MGLVARKDFIGNEGRQYKAGDPCDEALRWRYPALRACLNQGIIEDTTGEVVKHFGLPEREKLNAERQQRWHERIARRKAQAAVDAAPVEIKADERPWESDEIDLSSSTSSEPTADIAADSAQSEPISAATSSDGEQQPLVLESQSACADCGKAFDTPHGLKIHRLRAHRE